MDQLLSIALRNPTEIPTLARLLDLASRTICTAARELQRAARAWMSRTRQKAEAVLAIQYAARRRRAKLLTAADTITRAWRRHALEQKAAIAIQRRFRASCGREVVPFWLACKLCHDFLDAFGSGQATDWDVCDSSGDDPLQQSTAGAWQVADPLSRIAAALWAVAEQLGVLRPASQEIPLLVDRCSYRTINREGARATMAIMSLPTVDLDTRMLCHVLMHTYLWNIVESNGHMHCGLSSCYHSKSLSTCSRCALST